MGVLTFNELSLPPDHGFPFEAVQAALGQLGGIVVRLVSDGDLGPLHCDEGVGQRSCGEVTFAKALSLPGPGDRDGLRGLLVALSKGPYVQRLIEDTICSKLSEIHVDGERALGLEAAFVQNGLAVSYPRVPFCDSSVSAILVELTDEGEVEEGAICVRNVAKEAHLEVHAEHRRTLAREVILCGNSLVQHWGTYFPDLLLGPRAADQFADMHGHDRGFQHIVRALFELQRAVRHHRNQGGGIRPGMNHSHESKATLRHGTYGPLRDFGVPDGIRPKRFSMHLKIGVDALRVYWVETVRERDKNAVVVVGYAGAHLPTVKHPA